MCGLNVFRCMSLGVYAKANPYRPPKNCIPSNAVITMNRMSKNIKLNIDLKLLTNDLTRFCNEDQ